MSAKDPASPTKPLPTSNVKPNRLPAPTLFVGPPSRNASQISVARQGLSAASGRGKDPLHRQPSAFGRSTEKNGHGEGSKDTALPTVKKDNEKEADAKWREMQVTLNEVELTAQSSTHVFGESHAAALEELRRAQVELARAWGRGNEGKVNHAADEQAQAVVDRFGQADSIARDRQAGQRRRGGTDASASTVLSDESVLSTSTTKSGRSTLEDETAQDIKLASQRRAANEMYFKKVEHGVKDVVAKLEVVAEAMKGVEGESRSLWSQSSRSSQVAEGKKHEGKASAVVG